MTTQFDEFGLSSKQQHLLPIYSKNRRGFKLALRKIARELAELGV